MIKSACRNGCYINRCRPWQEYTRWCAACLVRSSPCPTSSVSAQGRPSKTTNTISKATLWRLPSILGTTSSPVLLLPLRGADTSVLSARQYLFPRHRHLANHPSNQSPRTTHGMGPTDRRPGHLHTPLRSMDANVGYEDYQRYKSDR